MPRGRLGGGSDLGHAADGPTFPDTGCYTEGSVNERSEEGPWSASWSHRAITSSSARATSAARTRAPFPRFLGSGSFGPPEEA